MIPTMTVMIDPKSSPEFLNALGIARIPVPSELFRRWRRAPVVLVIKFSVSLVTVELIIDLRVGFINHPMLEGII